MFLAASGLTLVFGILGVINLSHGSFYMLGAYAALTLTSLFGDIFVALALGLPLAFLFGMAIEWLFIRHLYARDHLQQVLLTFALILVFNEVQQSVWGNNPLSIPTPPYLARSVMITGALGYPVYRLALMAICLALALAMVFVIQKTRVGRLIRAAESNREMVEALGFDFAHSLPAGVRGGRGAGRRRRHARRAGGKRLSGHRRPRVDHLLRRRGDRRHRLDPRRLRRFAARSASPTLSAKCSSRNSRA